MTCCHYDKTRYKLHPRKPPCFGVHRTGFFRFVAVISSILTIIFLSFLIIDVWTNSDCFYGQGTCCKDMYYFRPIVWILLIANISIVSILDVLLFNRASTTNISHLNAYVYYTWASSLILIPVSIIFSWKMENLRYESRSFLIGYVIYKFYISFVIRIYIHDILYEAKSKSGYRDLFDHEITQFENGTERCTSSVNDVIDEGSDIENHLYQRYKREEFEIPMESLDFDDATQIGCGAYGCVYKLNYNIKTNGMKTAMTVAVKTVDPDLSDVTYFLTLLAEAKLMTYLGKHKHIVELIGVCTSKIRERKLYIVCELCSFGNLQMYLRSERSRFVPLSLPEHLDRIERQIVQPATCDLQNVNTYHLIRWCYEIGLGMEFLEYKKIIHGDLATRNVLLTEGRTAKITDFGLSRKLYNYSNYVKGKNVPLPWRWLAVEVLVDMNLSTKSDVWSYGITCWEIFELGKRPWNNYHQYSLEYIHDIQNGARLDKPNNCYQEIYDEVIALCWKDEPSARPSFSNIVFKLASFLCEDIID